MEVVKVPRKIDVQAYSNALADWAEVNPLRRFRHTNELNLRLLSVMLKVSEGTLRSWEIGSMYPGEVNMSTITAVTTITQEAWDQWAAGIPKVEAFAGRR